MSDQHPAFKKIARWPILAVSADSKSERKLQRRTALLVQTHSRVNVNLAHRNRPPPATSGDVHNPVVHARKRYSLNFLPASQNQRELALIRQGFRLFLGKARILSLQLQELLLLRRLLCPLLARALLLILSLILSRLRIGIRIQIRPRVDWQHIRPAAIKKNESVGVLRFPSRTSLGERQPLLCGWIDKRFKLRVTDRDRMPEIESKGR
jgi:hypothetical protein